MEEDGTCVEENLYENLNGDEDEDEDGDSTFGRSPPADHDGDGDGVGGDKGDCCARQLSYYTNDDDEAGKDDRAAKISL